MLAKTVVENRVEEDALQIRNVNWILALETSIGQCDWSVLEVLANIWQAINDLLICTGFIDNSFVAGCLTLCHLQDSTVRLLRRRIDEWWDVWR